jgi:hypothetical protein
MQLNVFNKHVATLAFISRMEDSIQSASGQARQFPRAGLMELSVRHGGWTTMGTGGMCKVTSAPLVPLHFLRVCYGSSHSAQLLHLGFAPVILLALRFLKPSPVWFSLTAMPWECGKPKRGPSWYSYAARQCRIHRLSQASSTSLICCDREKNSPPMAYVEEEIPEEPIMVPPDSLLYTVPDSQDPPSTSHSASATTCAMEGVTCIIQEEICWPTAQ